MLVCIRLKVKLFLKRFYFLLVIFLIPGYLTALFFIFIDIFHFKMIVAIIFFFKFLFIIFFGDFGAGTKI